MKNIAIIILTVLIISGFAITKSIAADYNFGISGSYMLINADGSEVETGSQTAETHKKSVSNDVLIGSVFAEVAFGKFAIGLDYIPFDADVSDKTHQRIDTETSVTSTETTTSTSRTQKAAAEVSDHTTIYVNYYLNDSFYLHLGHASVDLTTQESLDTGSKYGNATVDGIQYGAGVQMNDNFRLEAAYTDYDDISISSSVARTGVTTNNKIEADLDTLQFKLSYHF